MVYFAMALALFADDDYEEVAARLTETLRGWDCWDDAWEVPTWAGSPRPGSGGTRSRSGSCFRRWRSRLRRELTRGAFLGPWRLMAIDGFEWDAPATEANIAAFGFAGTGADDPEKAGVPEGPGGHGQRVRLACSDGRARIGGGGGQGGPGSRRWRGRC